MSRCYSSSYRTVHLRLYSRHSEGKGSQCVISSLTINAYIVTSGGRSGRLGETLGHVLIEMSRMSMQRSEGTGREEWNRRGRWHDGSFPSPPLRPPYMCPAIPQATRMYMFALSRKVGWDNRRPPLKEKDSWASIRKSAAVGGE